MTTQNSVFQLCWYAFCLSTCIVSPTTGPLKFEAYAAPKTPTPTYTATSVGGTSPSLSRPKQDTPPTPRMPNTGIQDVSLPLPEFTTETVEEKGVVYGPGDR